MNREYLCVDLVHRANLTARTEELAAMTGLAQNLTYEIELQAMAGDVPFRPHRVTAKPRIFGLESAIVDGPAESEFSNIYHYDPNAEADAPTWDIAGEGIHTANPGDMLVSIEWYEATDAESPPVTYLVYYAPSTSGIDS